MEKEDLETLISYIRTLVEKGGGGGPLAAMLAELVEIQNSEEYFVEQKLRELWLRLMLNKNNP